MPLLSPQSRANRYPQDPRSARPAGGPSCIQVGAQIDSQDAALRLYALGEVLGLWEVVTPGRRLVTGPEALQMARNGFVMMTGFRPDQPR